MRKVMLLTFVFLFLVSSAVMAHPPQSMNVNFDMETQVLNVEITHSVGGENSSHFIDNIVVTYNGSEVITQIPSKQLKNKEVFMYYMPGVVSGDEINVTAYCSIQGQRSFSLTIGE